MADAQADPEITHDPARIRVKVTPPIGYYAVIDWIGPEGKIVGYSGRGIDCPIPDEQHFIVRIIKGAQMSPLDVGLEGKYPPWDLQTR